MPTSRRYLRVLVATLAAAGVALAGANVAAAGLTTPSCLAQKRKAWGDLRKCQAGEAAKALKGKTADLAKCQARLASRFVKLDAKAAKAAVACRYGVNGDGTITDYDTGLQWELKLGVFMNLCPLNNPHCVSDSYTWPQAHDLVSRFAGTLENAVLVDAFAGFSDWRLPTVTELDSIFVGVSQNPRIDPIFGSTATEPYWTATSEAGDGTRAFARDFGGAGFLSNPLKTSAGYVRVVRTAF